MTEESSKTNHSSDTSQKPLSQMEEEIIYKVLANKTRREIIRFLHDKKTVGFVDLRDEFELQVGSLYHQLNSMDEFWVQDENKKYSLSELGVVAYRLLVLNKDQISSSTLPSKTYSDSKFVNALLSVLQKIFLPKKIFNYLVSEPLRSFFEGLLIIGAMLFFSIDGEKVLLGLFPMELEEWYFSLVTILGLWLIVALLLSTLASLFHKKPFRPFSLIAIFPFTMIPNTIILFCLWLQTKVSSTFLFLDGQILSIVGQIWSLTLTITAVSQSNKLTMKRSSLIVLIVFYLVYVIAFIVTSTI